MLKACREKNVTAVLSPHLIDPACQHLGVKHRTFLGGNQQIAMLMASGRKRISSYIAERLLGVHGTDLALQLHAVEQSTPGQYTAYPGIGTDLKRLQSRFQFFFCRILPHQKTGYGFHLHEGGNRFAP
ncbi:hypothetical protein D3C73_1029230 [compost metagenome]